MAFCRQCGGQVDEQATVCPSCGAARTVGQPAPVSSATPASAPRVQALTTDAGFVTALFDISFTSFVTTKLIKLIYVLSIVMAGITALLIAVGGFTQGGLIGTVMLLIVAPIAFLLSVISSRVFLELVVVLFRMAEHMAEIASRSRSIV